jgi:hypothetical protein
VPQTFTTSSPGLPSAPVPITTTGPGH